MSEEKTPQEIIAALKESGGSIPGAASKMGMAVSRLNIALSYGRNAKTYARMVRKWEKTGKAADAAQIAAVQQVEEDIRRKAVFFKHEAMDILMQLALQPMSENAYHNQIKMQAAMKLVDLPGVKLDSRTSDNLASTLQALNAEFEKNAPRLRVIRETVREMVEVSPASPAITAEAERLPD